MGLVSEVLTANSRRVSPALPYWLSIMPPWQAVLFYTFAYAIFFSIFGYVVEETEWGYKFIKF